MSTLGQKPATQHVSTEKQSITGNGGTSYTLQQSVSQASDIEVFVNNTRQEPTVAYTANNTTLTMTGAVNSSDSFYVIFQGKAIQTAGLPVDAAITASTVTTSQTITSTGNITTSGTVNTPSINGGQIGGRRNLIINGAMQVSQRVGTASSSANNYGATPDRIRQEAYGGASASFQQVTDAPTGFKNSLKVTCAGTTAPSSGNTLRLQTGLEGQDIAQLAYGTAQAKTSTLSFYVKASETGTYSAALVNIRPSGNITSNVTRSHIKTYTVNSANTWEYKTLTFPGCPDGTWGSSNSDGITIVLDLGSGTNHQGATNTWLTTSDTFASGQVTLGDSNGGTWQITGLQFEVGSQATPFEHRSFGEELALCQRYFQVYGGKADSEIYSGWAGNTSGYYTTIRFMTEMRVVPSITINGSFDTSNVSSASFTYGSKKGIALLVNPAGAGRWYWYANSADDTFTADSEL